jgi:hypothetical protein
MRGPKIANNEISVPDEEARRHKGSRFYEILHGMKNFVRLRLQARSVLQQQF